LRNDVGALVQLPHNWIIEGIFNYGESDATESDENAVNLLALQQAFNGTLPGHIGQFYNPFLDWRAVQGFSKVFYPSLLVKQTLEGRTDLVEWVLRTGGTVLDLCSGPLNVAAGLEYHSESLIQSNDQLSELHLIGNANFPGKEANGRRYVKSAYWEVDLPLAGDKWSWPGLRALDFTYSERYDDYSTIGGAAKPKFALRYKPFNDFTVRAAYSEGYRAPSLAELFGAAPTFPAPIIDPNFPASDPRHAYTVLVVQGANPNLRPQVAYSYYVEAVWVPDSLNVSQRWFHWLHGFTAYADWFQIEVRGRIGNVAVQSVVDEPTAFPGDSIIRSPITGQIVQVNDRLTNIATTNTRGIDFGGSYITKEYACGKIDFELNATYVYGFSAKILFPPVNGRTTFGVVTGDDQSNFAGPDFKLVASLFYSKTICSIDTVKTGLTLNYLDSEADFNNNVKGSFPPANPFLDAPGYVHLIGNWTTLDYQISYEFGKSEEITPGNAKPGYNKEGNRLVGEKAIAPKPEGSRWGWRQFLANTKFIFGINNLFDTRPPLSVDAIYLGRDTGNVNSVQRFFYFEIDKHF
jgi:iron complex outermembrane receptor protein